jgi:PAS domain S-box-containing protein
MSEKSDLHGGAIADALLDETSDTVFLLDSDLRIAQANRHASMLLGLAQQDLEGKQIDVFLRKQEGIGLKETAGLLASGGEKVSLRVDYVDYAGTTGSASSTLRLIAESRLDERLYLLTLRKARNSSPITGEYIDQQKLIGKLLHGLSDAVFIVDGESRVIRDCNSAAERIFGWSREELIGRTLLHLAADASLAADYVRRSRGGYASTGFFQDKILCRRKDGSIFQTLGTNIAFFNREGSLAVIVAINRDLSEDERRIDGIMRLAERSAQLMRELNESILPLKNSVPSQSLGDLGFSRRQIEVAVLLVGGETSKAIGYRLKLAEATVKSHLASLYRGLGVSSRVEFIKYILDHHVRLE